MSLDRCALYDARCCRYTAASFWRCAIKGEGMRRGARVAAVVAVGIVLLVPPAYADAENSGVAGRAGMKLVRGVVNLGTGWTEIVKQPYLIGKQQGWLAGTFRGTIEGLGMVVARTVGGAYEILTFPFPIPPGYQPMVEPSYVWEDEVEASGSRSDAETGRGGNEPQAGESEGL